MRISLPSVKLASSPFFAMMRIFSALHPQRSAKVCGLYGRSISVLGTRTRRVILLSNLDAQIIRPSWFPFGCIFWVLGDFVGFGSRSGALTARAGMDIVCVGYIGHGMLPTGLNRSRYVALTGLNRSRSAIGRS
jgi:hypothetical protein